MNDRDEYTVRLDDLKGEVHEVLRVATAAMEEARGAHTQAKRTNGRVDRHANRIREIDLALHGPTDQGVKGDGGILGYIRTQRRDLRLVGAWVVVGLPLVVAYLLNVI